MKRLILKTIAYFARKSHTVQIQVVLGAMYGLIAIYGVGPAIAIIMKLRKAQHATTVRNKRKVDSRLPKVQQPNNKPQGTESNILHVSP